jgi:hypothetical protein
MALNTITLIPYLTPRYLSSIYFVEKYRNPHGQLKENLFLPLFNTNFISKSFGGPLHNSAGKGTRHFNPLEDENIRFSKTINCIETIQKSLKIPKA